jgi:5'-nucleotidase (lipoprotein e(P4) family)
MTTRLASALATSLALAACTDAGPVDTDRGDGVDILGEDKADGVPGVELVARLAPGTLDGALTASVPRVAYVFPATAGAVVSLEVTQAGTATGLDTVLRVHGPRNPDGTYTSTVATDDDAGYGKLSKLASVALPAAGFYLVEVAPGGAAPTSTKKFRLRLTCGGDACASTAPVTAPGLDLRWVTRSAEYQAATTQAYRVASDRYEKLADDELLDGDSAVVLDLDETVLSNATYQVERAALGTGYSGPSWLAWTQRKAATLLPGAEAFLNTVRQRAGTIIFVTNRKAGAECDATKANLVALNVRYDAIYCRTGTSDKNPRFQAIENGTAAGLARKDIVMFVGDNIQDFPGMSQDDRGDDAAFLPFGAEQILVPNPMYGSWDSL